MKVTIVHGSPRKKGNTHKMVEALCDGFAPDTEISSFEAQKLTASGCLGCMTCKGKSDRCVINDDLTPVYDAMHESDVLVIASPIYFGDVTAQAKNFIDRLFHLFPQDFHDNYNHDGQSSTSRLKKGTKLVFITAQGSVSEEEFADVHPRYAKFFTWLGFKETFSIRGLGDPAAWETHRMDEAFEAARNLGKKLTASHLGKA
ncbi:flavodoxin family protein [Halodesulfovibrio spirochaetisodalis]|uniref:flavodoxin family protein n=1 Tax=Halodesulfovibrio spirochaetisodalis TaxID=1560234 RepID=UPI0008366E90|nr:flavodoxin family protein [Halodesulfovibrio spirochaetisodalis]